MGLDISLFEHQPTETPWPKEEDFLSAEACEEARKAYFEESDAKYQEARKTSVLHPDHLCGPRYLRSSYNSGGFDSYVPKLLGGAGSLYHIFFDGGDPYSDPEYVDYDEETETGGYWLPSTDRLQEARERAEGVLALLSEAEPFQVLTVSNFGRNQSTAEEAINILRDELDGEQPDHPFFGGWYSNGNGTFYLGDTSLDGVLAAIPGVDILGSPCVHLVRRSEENHQFYVDMAEIVIEFIDEALSMEQPEIHWSA